MDKSNTEHTVAKSEIPNPFDLTPYGEKDKHPRCGLFGCGLPAFETSITIVSDTFTRSIKPCRHHLTMMIDAEDWDMLDNR